MIEPQMVTDKTAVAAFSLGKFKPDVFYLFVVVTRGVQLSHAAQTLVLAARFLCHMPVRTPVPAKFRYDGDAGGDSPSRHRLQHELRTWRGRGCSSR